MRRENGMKQRQTHSKSRRGCLNCKKRHVKCDEQGPPCANCVVRKTKCSYSNNSPTGSSAQLDTQHLDPASALTAPAVAPLHSETSRGSSSKSSISLSPPQSSLSRIPSPSEASMSSHSIYSEPHQADLDARRLLELELMHRWSTHTYLAMTSYPEEYPLMQNIMPREALRHDFVLHIMFALTSLDLAVHVAPTEEDAASYTRRALDYYESASAAFHRQLLAGGGNPHDHWLMYMAATADTAYHLAVFGVARGTLQHQAPHTSTALSHVVSLFDTWTRATKAGVSNFDALLGSPATALQSMLRLPATLDVCDADTQAAVARLHSVNDALHDANAFPDEPRPLRPIGPALDTEPLSKHEMYRRAVFHLGTCFAEDATGVVPSFCASLPSLTGARFARAVGEGEPMALLVLMHWAVLLHRMGLRCWWAAGVGECLVGELSETLPHSEVALLQAGQEGMTWTRGQVGLSVWGSWDVGLGVNDVMPGL